MGRESWGPGVVCVCMLSPVPPQQMSAEKDGGGQGRNVVEALADIFIHQHVGFFCCAWLRCRVCVIAVRVMSLGYLLCSLACRLVLALPQPGCRASQ